MWLAWSKYLGKVTRHLLRLGVPALRNLCCNSESLLVQFDRAACNSLTASSLLLDAGCGTESRITAQGKCKLVVGIDREPPTSATHGVDVRVIGDLSHLPFRENTFDVITCFEVVEHLEDPEACFREFYRACKSDGLVIVVTPNLWYYEALVIKVTPYWFHKWFIHVILAGSGDPCPTKYLANTLHRLVGLMGAAGFEPIDLRLLDFGPWFLHWFTPAYALGVIYHRLINRFSKLAFLRQIILAVFRKE